MDKKTYMPTWAFKLKVGKLYQVFGWEGQSQEFEASETYKFWRAASSKASEAEKSYLQGLLYEPSFGLNFETQPAHFMLIDYHFGVNDKVYVIGLLDSGLFATWVCMTRFPTWELRRIKR